LTEKRSAEENLTKELSENEALKAKTVELEEKRKELLALLDESRKKVEEVATQKEQEFKSLLLEKTQLMSEKSELENKVKELSETAKKATEEIEGKVASLLSTNVSLESNLTQHTEHEKALEEENQKLTSEKSVLQGKIDELLSMIEQSKQKAQLSLNSLMSQEKSLESENATLKATLEKLKEAKAAAEAKAKEEAEKAAAEAKAKEEAEKAAAEAKAKEEAEKAAAEAKAKEAESKLMKAFSLTHVAFRTGSANLTLGSKERLDMVVSTMKNYEGYSYKIQGHTDSVGDESANLALSGKRAEAVKRYLVSQGIDEYILSAEGFGSSYPIASNETKAGREKNRRVVFKIIQ